MIANADTGIHKNVWLSFLLVALLLIGIIFFLDINGRPNDVERFASLKAKREALIETGNSIRVNWLRTLNPLIKKTEGDLVWDNEKQKGVMHFVNLPENRDEQIYHLWIYDLHLPQEDPISAGEFTVREEAREYYAEVKPKRRVMTPLKFILMLEDKNNKGSSKPQSLLLAQP